MIFGSLLLLINILTLLLFCILAAHRVSPDVFSVKQHILQFHRPTISFSPQSNKSSACTFPSSLASSLPSSSSIESSVPSSSPVQLAPAQLSPVQLSTVQLSPVQQESSTYSLLFSRSPQHALSCPAAPSSGQLSSSPVHTSPV